MPHIHIETDAPHGLSASALAEALHAEATTIEAFPLGGIRTRLHVPDVSHVAVGLPDAGFAYVRVRIGKGRPEDVRRDIGERLFRVVEDWAAPALEADEPISLGLEVEEIAGPTFKRNTIHGLLKG